MNDTTKPPPSMESLLCLESLDAALAQAGGGPYSVAYLKSITALELISVIAPNDVRFCHVGPKKGKGKS